MTEFNIRPLASSQATMTADQVFDVVQNAIVTLNLHPGAKISENEIAGQLDVSRQPVRDAFFRLSKLGLLTIRPQRATLISKISVESLRRAAFVRTALETSCIREATRLASEDDLADLQKIVDQQAIAITDEPPERFHNLDDALHAKICACGGHPYVWPLVVEQKTHMDRVRFLSLSFGRPDALTEHQAIVSAMQSRDQAAAQDLLQMHLGKIELILQKVRDEHPDYFQPED